MSKTNTKRLTVAQQITKYLRSRKTAATRADIVNAGLKQAMVQTSLERELRRLVSEGVVLKTLDEKRGQLYKPSV